MVGVLLQVFTCMFRIKVCTLEERWAHPGCLWGEAWARQEKSLQSELHGGYH